MLDLLPIWGVFLATVALVVLGIGVGYRVGRRRQPAHEDGPPVGEIVAATLALFGFMLAFTFSLAASRFDLRREMLVDEANAIGTTYLRAGILPEPHGGAVRDLLRQYVDARLEAAQPGRFSASLRRSEAIHGELWAHAEAVGRAEPHSIVVGLFLQSLNEMIDLHTKRVGLGARVRMPGVVWLALYGLALAGTTSIGYHAGITTARLSPVVVALILSFAVVITLIADLDRPLEGFLQVNQQSLLDLKQSMGPPGR